MRAEFTELTYGFALIYEMINNNSFNINIPPTFFSQVEEGRVHGSDAELNFEGYPFFLQVKVSEYMIRRNSNEWNIYGSPYYRFKTYSYSVSKQHEKLLNFQNDTQNAVFYVAPIMHLRTQLNEAYIFNEIMERSIFIEPRAIGELPDENAHSIVFHENYSEVYRCSEPKEIEYVNKLTVHSLYKEIKQNSAFHNEHDLEKLAKKMLKIAIPHEEEQRQFKNEFQKKLEIEKVEYNNYRFIAYIAGMLFNLQFGLMNNNEIYEEERR